MAEAATKGEVLIHPALGPVRVTKISQRPFKGVATTYLTLDPVWQPKPGLCSELVVMIPEEEAWRIGVRRPLSFAQLKDVRAVLVDTPQTIDTNWAHRHRAETTATMSADVLTVAAAVRDLYARQRCGSKFSLAERNLLDDTLARLQAEFAVVLGDNSAEMFLHAALETAVASADAGAALSVA